MEPVSRRFLAAVVVAGLILGTLGMANIARNGATRAVERDEAQQARDIATVLRSEVQKAAAALDGAPALADADADGTIAFSSFEAFGRAVRRPPMASLSYARLVRSDDRAAFEQQTGHPIVDIRPGEPPQPAPPRDTYFPVVQVVPMIDTSRGALGLDLAADPVRGPVARKALAFGRAQMTPATRLLPSGTPGFVIIQPVYEPPAAPGSLPGRVTGFVTAVFIGDDLLDLVPARLMRGTAVRLDGDGVELARRGPRPVRAHEASVPVMDRSWTLVLDNRRAADLTTAWALLAAGLGFTALVVYTFRRSLLFERDLVESRRRAAFVADLTTRLAASDDTAAVGRGALECVAPAFDPLLMTIDVLRPGSDSLDVVALVGAPAAMERAWRRVPLDFPGPAAEVVTPPGRRLEFEDRRSLVAAYPAFDAPDPVSRPEATILQPLPAGETIAGMLTLSFENPRALTREERELLDAVAPVIGQALQRAQLFEMERDIALTLQTQMLAEPEWVPSGTIVATRYLPASDLLEVGGDWYDVVALAGGRIAVVVGDVVGRGLEAASTMGKLRSAVRALLYTEPAPGALLGTLDRFARDFSGADCATLAIAIVDPSRRTLQYVTAGHPPPLLADDSGVRALDDARTAMIGAATDRPSARFGRVDFGKDATLVMFSDGLVEHRERPLEAGIAQLASILDGKSSVPVEQLADDLLEHLLPEPVADDVALVVLRLERSDAPWLTLRFPALADELAPARRRFAAWLDRHGVGPDLRDELTMAVNEACTNAIEHGYRDVEPGPVLLETHLEGDTIAIRVRDWGVWRPTPPDETRRRGFVVMRAFADDVSVTRTASGTTVRMRRTLERAPARS
jgi:anti-sigma regulatory factor (Ser/Thr protein kinase)